MFVNSKLSLVMQPELFPVFEESAINVKLAFTIGTDDLQAVIDSEKRLKQTKIFSLDSYNELDEIYQYLDDTAASYPEKVSVSTIGTSYEGRLLKLLKISTSESNPGVFIESNIHAREWISSATSLWFINEILTTVDPTIRELVDSVTWYFLVIANPDGLHTLFTFHLSYETYHLTYSLRVSVHSRRQSIVEKNTISSQHFVSRRRSQS